MIGFQYSDETRMLVDTVEAFVRNEVEPLESEVADDGTIPRDKVLALREKAISLGMFAMGMPAEVGGGGLSTVDLCLVDEKIGRVTSALSRNIFGQVYPMLTSCKGEQRERYLLPTVRGDKICAMAITEPGAGSDAASISTTAVRDGESWVLNGGKHFISDGDVADYVIVMALTDPAKRGRGGITLFLVDKGAAGFKVGRVQKMMGHNGYGHAELFFENVRLTDEHILGEVGEGFRLIMKSVARVRLANVGARGVGMAERALEMAARYATERKQFGQEIGNFQMIQKMLADMATDIFAARMMVLNTAWEVDQGLDPRQKISMVKLFASEMVGRVTDQALQVFGGMGYSRELPIERLYRDCRVMRIFDGTSEIHRGLIAQQVLKAARGR